MKQKKYPISAIVCIILAVALLMSVIALISAKSEISALKDENLALQAKLESSSAQTQITPVISDERYCTLIIDTWSVQGDILSAGTFVQAVIPNVSDYTAQIELWKGNNVLDSMPVTLEPGEEAGIYETDVSVEFEIPEITADEELQLWLTIDLGDEVIYSCGAGWYLENDQLMLITG